MDIENLQKHLSKLESGAAAIAAGSKKSAEDLGRDAKLRESVRTAMRDFAGTLRTLLMDLLKERKEPVRPGQLYRDAAAKNLVPGDVAGDKLMIKWGGHVTPTEAKEIHEECARFATVAEKLLPVLKSYEKE